MADKFCSLLSDFFIWREICAPPLLPQENHETATVFVCIPLDAEKDDILQLMTYDQVLLNHLLIGLVGVRGVSVATF